MSECIIDGCSDKRFGHGWCNKHYYRWRRYGDVTFGRQEPDYRIRTFWMSVNVTADPTRCWEWGKQVNAGGYGEITFQGIGKLAHRVAWEITFGDIPNTMCILHRCDNRPCVNPNHLFLGTRQDNIVDRDTKGRHSHGEKHPSAKLTENDVRMVRTSERQGVELAKRLNVTPGLIAAIRKRRIWKHVQ